MRFLWIVALSLMFLSIIIRIEKLEANLENYQSITNNALWSICLSQKDINWCDRWIELLENDFK